MMLRERSRRSRPGREGPGPPTGLLMGSALLVVWTCTALASAPAARGDAVLPAPDAPLPSVLVEVRTATWKPRGRVLFDVKATVRNKLSGVGFPIVRDPEKPHDLTLTLDYREERGRQYDVMAYQTIVTGRFRLEGQGSTTLLELSVQERSAEQLGGTPPYIDAIQRFETNPSVFFLGDIVRGRLQGEPARAPALIAGLRRVLGKDASRIDPLSAPHTMMAAESSLPKVARQRAIRELGRLGDPQAVPFLRELLSHEDPAIRQTAGQALATFESPEAAPPTRAPAPTPAPAAPLP